MLVLGTRDIEGPHGFIVGVFIFKLRSFGPNSTTIKSICVCLIIYGGQSSPLLYYRIDVAGSQCL